ncbi:MAG TPA: 4-hydroxy-3-methylbut-2-enyl diphosphate reductase [Candidatus Sumerlaeota bacterium]|nr:4-hydroxy-3-methylbut-2-enyl diphosphate reductase [Candidatus Sumerlaeota bacterium]
MKIIQAKAAGFCMGVRRAMQIVLDQGRYGKKPVVTHGPLIHNPQVIQMLEEKGIGVYRPGMTEVPLKGTMVIRAHGIVPEEMTRLEKAGYTVVDATCTHVIRIQKLIERHIRLGEAIVIVGDPGHAEVNGLLGHAEGLGYVVATDADVAALPALEKVCVVSQTTQNPEHFDHLLGLIQTRWPGCSVHRTICNSTCRRQTETEEIARRCDAMIIVGGKNSANTVRLAELSAALGTPTQHIETSSEINFEALRGARTIGLTAGASTPNWLITDVAEHVAEWSRGSWNPLRRALHGGMQFLLNTNLYLTLGVVCMMAGCVALQGAQFHPLQTIVAALYVFAMHSINMHYDHHIERYTNPARYRFQQRWGKVFLILGGVSLVFTLAFAWFLGVTGFLLMLIVCGLGLLYRLPIVPRFLTPWLPYRGLRDMAGSKDILMGLAWAFVLPLLAIVPDTLHERAVLMAGVSRSMWAGLVTFFFVFTLVFLRSVVYDLRDIQGDQMLGRETIPVAMGTQRTYLTLALLTGALFVTLFAASYGEILSSVGYLMLLPVLYTAASIYLFRSGILQPRGVLFETLIGGSFVLVGIVVLISH